MRTLLRTTLAGCVLASAVAAQTPDGPRLASMTSVKMLLLPSQEAVGVGDARAWLARFDSVLTAQLENGGIGSAWAYPRDAARYARQNPSYFSDPRNMGAQPLKTDKLKPGSPLPEPFSTRSRMIMAMANASAVIVPVVARLDSTTVPRSAQLQLTVVDPKTSKVAFTELLKATYAGNAMAAADTLALTVARLFISK